MSKTFWEYIVCVSNLVDNEWSMMLDFSINVDVSEVKKKLI